MQAVILTQTGAPDAAQLAQPRIAKLWKSAQSFEAMALGELLGPMFDTVDSAHGPFGGGDGEATWRPMLTQEMARRIAAGGGLGLAVPVFHQMLQMQEAAGAPTA
jgi:Rod binding domain-containing protein